MLVLNYWFSLKYFTNCLDVVINWDRTIRKRENRKIKITETYRDKRNSTRCAAIDLSVQTNARKLIGVLLILLTSKTVSHLLDFSVSHTQTQYWRLIDGRSLQKYLACSFVHSRFSTDSYLILVNLKFASKNRKQNFPVNKCWKKFALKEKNKNI